MPNPRFPSAVPGLVCIHQGKVRDTFEIPGRPDLLLVVATDRVSTHNIVHGSLIPGKGQALTELTVFWMNNIQDIDPDIDTHLYAHGDEIYSYIPRQDCPTDLHLRAVIVRRLIMIPFEFIFRSRMAGSLWKDFYQKGQPNPYGLVLPPGLRLMSPFGETVFTPTDKSEMDDPRDANEVMRMYPEAYRLALSVYEKGRKHAAERGIEIIDGKFEVGIDDHGKVILADECLTPDSCRFVEASKIVVGNEPSLLDKQYLREEAELMWAGGKKTPVTFSPAVIEETMRRYSSIVQKLTGGS
jgi:phosphoribosylaminoimidazole-succinocarboxamide synthase